MNFKNNNSKTSAVLPVIHIFFKSLKAFFSSENVIFRFFFRQIQRVSRLVCIKLHPKTIILCLITKGFHPISVVNNRGVQQWSKHDWWLTNCTFQRSGKTFRWEREGLLLPFSHSLSCSLYNFCKSRKDEPPCLVIIYHNLSLFFSCGLVANRRRFVRKFASNNGF